MTFPAHARYVWAVCDGDAPRLRFLLAGARSDVLARRRRWGDTQ